MASRSTASTKGARDKGLQKWQVSFELLGDGAGEHELMCGSSLTLEL